MRGWFVHNRFFYTQAFRDQADCFRAAAERKGILLDFQTNTETRALLIGDSAEGLLPDFVLFWDKDVPLAQTLEKAGVPVYNPSEAIRLCDDKTLTYLALAHTGIPMPETVPVPFSFGPVSWDSEPLIDKAADALGYPLVVKASHGSFGQQVWLANNRTELVARLNALSPEPALLQRYVRFSHGRDKRLYVIGDRVAAAMLRTSEADFRANLALGGKAEIIRPNEEETEIALRACGELGLVFGGVDLLFGEDGHPLLCEVNSNAHIRNLSRLSGVPLAERILEEIVSRLSAGA